MRNLTFPIKRQHHHGLIFKKKHKNEHLCKYEDPGKKFNYSNLPKGAQPQEAVVFETGTSPAEQLWLRTFFTILIGFLDMWYDV